MRTMERGLTEREFALFRDLIYKMAGVHFGSSKKALVFGRLSKRLRELGIPDFTAYHRYVMSPEGTGEKQIVVDLLTTHETHFFREPEHFRFLGSSVLAGRDNGTPLRVWSAASSTGEEAFSVAMVLADHLKRTEWSILGTDISQGSVQAARTGIYSMERLREIPPYYRQHYCLKGVGASEGSFTFQERIRSRIRFECANLLEMDSMRERFEIVLLKNVMIYFNDATKKKIVETIKGRLLPDGFLFLGLTESMNGLASGFRPVERSIYRMDHTAFGRNP